MENIGSIVTIGILAAVGVLFLFGFLRGLRKGLWKSLTDLGFVIVCLFLSILISKWITNSIMDISKMAEVLESLKGSMPDMAPTIDSVLEYINSVQDNAGMISAILAIPAALITPIVFMLVHIVLGIIIKIPKLILQKVLFGPNKGENYRGGNRLAGGFIGGVRNALFIVILIIPILGYANLASDTLGTIESIEMLNSGASGETSGTESMGGESTESGSIKADFLDPVLDSPAVKAINGMGGNAIFNSLTTKRVEDAKISLTVEVDCFARLYANAQSFMDTELAEFGDEQKSSIENIKVILHEAELVPYVVSEALSFAADSWLNGNAVFGMEKINVGEDFSEAFDNLLRTLSETNKDNIKTDFDTVANLVEICIDEKLFEELGKEEGSVMSVIQKEEFLVKTFSEIYKNERTRPAIGFISNTVVGYIYDIYDEVNGTQTQKPEKLDISGITATDIENEAKILSDVIASVNIFLESIENLDPNDENALIKAANLAILGKALDNLRASIMLGDASDFLIVAMLKSETVAEMGFVNQEFINNITKEGTSLENTLASAQKLAIMALSLSDTGLNSENMDDAIKFMITEMNPETAETIKSVLTEDLLSDFGLSTEESTTVSNTINSVIDGMISISESTSNMTEEEIQKEVDAVNTLVGVMKDAASSAASGNAEAGNIFGAEGESATGVTTEELIDTVVSSQIVTDAIKNASKDSEDNVVEDPFGVAGTLSESDKTAAEDAMKEYYNNNSTGDAESDEELKSTLDSLANVLGLNSSNWFN